MSSSKFDKTDLHKTAYTIERVLIENSIDYVAFTHEEAITSEEASALRPEYTLSQGVKALIVKVDKKESEKGTYQYAQVVVPGDKKFNNSKIRKLLGARSIYFVSEEELATITDGVKPGGVPPFGNIFSLDVYADETIFQNEKVIFNCGDRRASIAIAADDYKKIVSPIICDIV